MALPDRLNLFCVRPRGHNVGNETISFAVRGLLRRRFSAPLNLVPVPAIPSEEDGWLSGLQPRSVHEMNLYGQGVVLGGGNLYENGQLDLDLDALAGLRPPLLLLSLSYGRIYDARRRLQRRTDAMSDARIRALNEHAVASVARDDATVAHLRAIGVTDVVLGGCPTLLLADMVPPAPPTADAPVLLSLRHPRLMSVPLADQERVHGEVRRIIDALRAEDLGPVRLLCHDKRDLAFAASFGDVESVLPDDVNDYLGLLRSARLVVAFRLHAFVPCLSFGTPAVHISYDERSESLVRTLGLADWNLDFLAEEDLAAAVVERARSGEALAELVAAAQPTWAELTATTQAAIDRFAEAVTVYAADTA